MSQVSTDYFDLIFSRRTKIENRIEKMERKIENTLEMIEDLSDDPITISQQRSLGELEGLLSSTEDRLISYRDDLTELSSYQLPEDEFVFSDFKFKLNKKGNLTGKMKVSITDSPYDDSYIGGESISIRVSGTQDGITRSVTLGTYQDGYGPIDETDSWRWGSNVLADIYGMGEFTITVQDRDTGEIISEQNYDSLAF